MECSGSQMVLPTWGNSVVWAEERIFRQNWITGSYRCLWYPFTGEEVSWAYTSDTCSHANSRLLHLHGFPSKTHHWKRPP